MSARLATVALAIGYDGVPLAEDIHLTVGEREIVAVLGPSGTGKSTLLATIAGVTPPLAGIILVDGQDVTTAPIHERGVGMIFQESLLFGHLDVRDNVAYGLRRHGVSRPAARAQAEELLDWVGLSAQARESVDRLSGGQAQRVALVRALAPAPSVLLLDEPFSALDRELRERLAVEVAVMLREQGTAALHVTHDAAEAEALADRVLRL